MRRHRHEWGPWRREDRPIESTSIIGVYKSTVLTNVRECATCHLTQERDAAEVTDA